MNKIVWIVIVVLLVLLGIWLWPVNPTEVPSDDLNGGDETSMPAGDTERDRAINATQADLVAILEVEPDITNIEAERAEWPNGCLGLGGEDELCTEAIVSGWKIEITTADQEVYFYRTNLDGTVVRLEEGVRSISN